MSNQLMTKPYSKSCDQNREPILSIIKPLLADSKHVFEIGSGTGQHAVYFAKELPHLTWQCSDQEENHEGINQWLSEAKLSNTPGPIVLDVSQSEWPNLKTDALYSANAVHIMSWNNVIDFIKNAGEMLETDGLLILYDPFNYNNKYTSESNEQFDIWLKDRNPKSGIRDFEAINTLAVEAGLTLKDDFTMPANNRILCWRKV